MGENGPAKELIHKMSQEARELFFYCLQTKWIKNAVSLTIKDYFIQTEGDIYLESDNYTSSDKKFKIKGKIYFIKVGDSHAMFGKGEISYIFGHLIIKDTQGIINGNQLVLANAQNAMFADLPVSYLLGNEKELCIAVEINNLLFAIYSNPNLNSPHKIKIGDKENKVRIEAIIYKSDGEVTIPYLPFKTNCIAGEIAPPSSVLFKIEIDKVIIYEGVNIYTINPKIFWDIILSPGDYIKKIKMEIMEKRKT